MLMAGVMALTANDLKRVLAYSTISQLGLMVFAVGSGALLASQFHLLNHAVFKALLFLSAGAVIHITGTRDLDRLGRLTRVMPVVRNAFVVGALALAGVPIWNGFWSKELILESSAPSMGWISLGLVLAGVGLTALYTARVTDRVFFMRPAIVPGGSGNGHVRAHGVHDAPGAMRVALGLLVLGAFTTWLLIGGLSELLAQTLPYLQLETLSLEEMVTEIVTAPLTYLALAVMLGGFAAWWQRDRLAGVSLRLIWVRGLADTSFGFDRLNAQVVNGTWRAAQILRHTQTGQLNWNLLGLVSGLILVLVVLIVRR
jgi:NADH-quinone oxidoreductase subunit L